MRPYLSQVSQGWQRLSEVYLRQPCWFEQDGVRLPRVHKGWQSDQRAVSGTMLAGVTRGHKANDAFRSLSTSTLLVSADGPRGVALCTGPVGWLSARVQWHRAIALAQVSQGGQHLQRPIRAEPCRFRWVEQIGAPSVAPRYCKKPLCYKAVGTFRGLSTLNPAGFVRYTSSAATSQGPRASHSAIIVAPYGRVLPCLTRRMAPVRGLSTSTLLVSAGCSRAEQISGGSAARRSRSAPSR